MGGTKPISTLMELLSGTGARLRLFDMGRRVVKIPRDQFLRFEKNQLPYPAPIGQLAWLALLFQPLKSAREPFVWFLRFPLDEQAKLSLAARDDFLHRLMERIGTEPAEADEEGRIETALEDNPYGFKPRDDRLAIFHARISHRLKKPASRYHDHARSYFSGELGWDQWSFVGYQGIADIAARLAEDDNERMLIDALPLLPVNPFEALCHCLENEKISPKLAAVLLDLTHSQLRREDPSTGYIAAAVRAISRSRSLTLKRQLISDVLASPAAESAGVLGAISGRAWETLTEDLLVVPFLERLANNSEGQLFFDQCLSDLLFIPGMREPLLKALRAPDRSLVLSQAVGAFFQTLGRT
jgi:hypothetical protein